MLPAVALFGFGGTLAAVAWQAGLFSAGAGTAYARGDHHEGEPLPGAHALARQHQRIEHKAALPRPAASDAPVPVTSPKLLSLRYGCVWGQPGRNPYRGDVEQALRSAALPEEVVRSVAAQVRDRQPVDTLEISNSGVRALGSGRVFDARNIALTYGTTLCLGSRVNFVEGHVEKAALYEAATADGRVMAVMVPEVCGNVSVLGQSDERVRYERLNGARADAADGARWMPAVLHGPQADGAAAGSLHDVPEPGTLSCVLAALGALGVVRWMKRR
jgi:PEP-CTERM motif